MVRCNLPELNKPNRFKETRATFYYNSTTENENNNISESRKEIAFMPNYKVKNNKIDLDSRKPNLKYLEQSKWTIKPELKFRTTMIESKEKLETKLMSCGKLFCLYVYRGWNRIIYLLEGSFSIVKFDNDIIKAVSALHVVNFVSPQEFDIFIFGSFDEKISTSKIEKLKLKIREKERSTKANLSLLREFLKKNNMFEFTITANYLKCRKNFLKDIQNTEAEQILLDPQYNMQPMPSVDMVLLDLPKSLISKIENNEITALNISKKKNPKVGYLIAFHCNNGVIDNKSDEYCKTEMPDYLPMEALLNSDKSIGVCAFKTYTENIITYYATTGDGSSGGCILDEEGDIIAISFGSYYDRESESKCNAQTDSFDFISVKEDKSNYLKSKNINLALNLNNYFSQCFLVKFHCLAYLRKKAHC